MRHQKHHSHVHEKLCDLQEMLNEPELEPHNYPVQAVEMVGGQPTVVRPREAMMHLRGRIITAIEEVAKLKAMIEIKAKHFGHWDEKHDERDPGARHTPHIVVDRKKP